MVAFGMVQLFFFGVPLAVDWRFFTLMASINNIWINTTSTTFKYYKLHVKVYKKSCNFSDIQYYTKSALCITHGRPFTSIAQLCMYDSTSTALAVLSNRL